MFQSMKKALKFFNTSLKAIISLSLFIPFSSISDTAYYFEDAPDCIIDLDYSEDNRGSLIKTSAFTVGLCMATLYFIIEQCQRKKDNKELRQNIADMKEMLEGMEFRWYRFNRDCGNEEEEMNKSYVDRITLNTAKNEALQCINTVKQEVR